MNRALIAEGERSGGSISYDFRAFFYRGGASLSPTASRDDLARRRSGPVQQGRVVLVKALHESYLERKLSGSAPYSLDMCITAMRAFWKLCDRENLRFSGLNVAHVRNAIAKFANEQVHRFRSGEIKERSVGTVAWNAVGLLADALGVEPGELTGRTTLPRINTGRDSNAHEKLDLTMVKEFALDLASVIDSLSGERLYSSYPVQIQFAGGVAVPYFGYGPPPAGGVHSFRRWSRRRIESHKNFDRSYRSRLPLIQIRVQAECLRFIEDSAMNLAQVLALIAEDVSYRSYSGEYEVSGFKNRAGHDVAFRISKSYRPAFERYLAFRRTILAESPSNALFPFSGKNGIESRYVATRGFRSLLRVFKAAGKPFVTSHLLRYAKGQKVIHLIATGGNVGAVASKLQNTIAVVLRSYLMGSQPMATAEFTRFLRTISDRTAKTEVRAGGDCKAPNRPAEIDGLAEGVPKPDCINPAGCLFCKHYRGVRSKDYLHKILSYRAFLRIRAGIPASSTRSVDLVVVPTIDRINDFVEEVSSTSLQFREIAADVERMVASGDFHRTWRGWIELLYIDVGDENVHA